MKFFRPHFMIATLAGEQDRLISKIGGLPWGLPEKYWPTCCGQPQKLLAQLRHEPPMLDLGSPGMVLHLFQCLECCGIDDCGRGAVLLNESDLGHGLVRIKGHDVKPELGNSQIGELCIDGWKEDDDGIPSARLSEFFDEESVRKLHDEFPTIEWFDGRGMTKFGGSPRWTGNGPFFEPVPFEFLFQLNHYLFLDGLPPDPNKVGCGVTTCTQKQDGSSDQVRINPDAGNTQRNAPWFIIHDRESDYHYANFTNLGSDGTLYVFIDRTRQPHEVRWLWSR
jgi:hypothetical protein